MAINDFTGQNIKDSYQRVIQTDGTNTADGTGSLLPISFDGNNVIISGSLVAHSYVVSESITAVSSGSTIFGNSSDDIHQITGSLDTLGPITASSDISASGDSHIFGGNISIDQDIIHLGNPDTKISFADTDTLDLHTGGTIRVRLHNTLNVLNQDTKVNGSLEVTGHITASNTISASGFITDGHVTASGNVSASGVVESTKYFIHGREVINYLNTDFLDSIDGVIYGNNSTIEHAYYQVSSSGLHQFLSAPVAIGGTDHFGGTARLSVDGNIGTDSHITASGNISSSGDIIATNISASGDISSSGAISASGNIHGNAFHVDGASVLFEAAGSTGIGTFSRGTILNGSTITLGFGAIPITATGPITFTGNVQLGNATSDKVSISSSLFAGSHITASGNIEASSYVSASEFRTTGHITASGNISASGDILATGNIFAGWHGSTTRIKLLPSDFQPDEIGRPVMTDTGTSDERHMITHASGKALASVPIPTGYQATHAKISGSDTGQTFTTYEANIGNKDVTTIGSATAINTEKALTATTSTDNNYLLIEVTSDGASDEIYGGYVTITNT